MNRAEVVDALRAARAELLEAIDGLSDSDLAAPGVAGDWSVKDILSHVTACEAELVRALAQLKLGRRSDFWDDRTDAEIDALNAKYQRQNKNKPLRRVLEDFEGVRKQTIKQVESLRDADLTGPFKYARREGQPLVEFIAGDSFGHERDHIADIQNWRQKRSG